MALDLGCRVVEGDREGRVYLATEGGDVAIDAWIDLLPSGVRLGPGWAPIDRAVFVACFGGGVA